MIRALEDTKRSKPRPRTLVSAGRLGGDHLSGWREEPLAPPRGTLLTGRGLPWDVQGCWEV